MMGPKLLLVLNKSTLFNLKLKYYKLLRSEVINTVYKMCVMVNELLTEFPLFSALNKTQSVTILPTTFLSWL